MVDLERLKVKLEMLFEDILYVNDTLWLCKHNGYWLLYDAVKSLLKHEYEFYSVERIDENNIVCLLYGGIFILNRDGEFRIQLDNKYIYHNSYNGLLHLSLLGGLHGVINIENKQVVPYVYVDIKFYEGFKGMVLWDGISEVVVDCNGKLLCDGIYDSIIPTKKGNYLVYNREYGEVLDINGGKNKKYKLLNVNNDKIMYIYNGVKINDMLRVRV